MFKTLIAVIKFFGYLVTKNSLLRKAKRLNRKGKIAERDVIVNAEVSRWARYVVGLTGSTVEVTGEENIPADTPVVFVGNHQSYLDIPVILGHIAKPKAFIAKIEILKVPMLSKWMQLMQCVFLDRKNMRQSVKAMHDAVDTVKQGYSLVIFPEGTRSRGGPVAEFKAGSFKLALNAGVPIIPVTVDGTWHLYEETGKMASGHVKLTVHPAIPTANLSREEASAIPERVRAIVASSIAPSDIVPPKTGK